MRKSKCIPFRQKSAKGSGFPKKMLKRYTKTAGKTMNFGDSCIPFWQKHAKGSSFLKKWPKRYTERCLLSADLQKHRSGTIIISEGCGAVVYTLLHAPIKMLSRVNIQEAVL